MLHRDLKSANVIVEPSGDVAVKLTGTLAGEPLPEGLIESQQLPDPIFSPATKAQTGHDENIPFSGVVEHLGEPEANRLRDLSFTVYEHGATIAQEHGIILADTRVEVA